MLEMRLTITHFQMSDKLMVVLLFFKRKRLYLGMEQERLTHSTQMIRTRMRRFILSGKDNLLM
ncbi:hypothetical protein NQ318_009585 [Aromia moschata]|uniref:Uncharacterized protein n=1 Tax=Aromia moschata TaxID=1265417 RepID=A0AAV8Y413_9CUCU|nr:hypothetical protein NQ318_009585 [Aromia moschata]